MLHILLEVQAVRLHTFGCKQTLSPKSETLTPQNRKSLNPKPVPVAGKALQKSAP